MIVVCNFGTKASLGVDQKYNDIVSFLKQENEEALYIKRLSLKLLKADRVVMRSTVNFSSLLVVLFLRSRVILEENRSYMNFEGSKKRFILFIRFLGALVFYRLVNTIWVTNYDAAVSFENSIFKNKVKRVYNPFSALQRILERDSDRIKDIGFVGVFVGDLRQPWQGGRNLLKLLSDPSVSRVHVVGPVVEEFSHHKICWHGIKRSVSEITEIVGRAHFGIGPLNMSMRKMKQVTALKHAFYISAQIPIVLDIPDSLCEQIDYPIIYVHEMETNGTLKDLYGSKNIHTSEYLWSLTDICRGAFSEII